MTTQNENKISIFPYQIPKAVLANARQPSLHRQGSNALLGRPRSERLHQLAAAWGAIGSAYRQFFGASPSAANLELDVGRPLSRRPKTWFAVASRRHRRGCRSSCDGRARKRHLPPCLNSHSRLSRQKEPSPPQVLWSVCRGYTFHRPLTQRQSTPVSCPAAPRRVPPTIASSSPGPCNVEPIRRLTDGSW